MNRNRKFLQSLLILSSFFVASSALAQQAPKPLVFTQTEAAAAPETVATAAPEVAKDTSLNNSWNRKNASLADKLKWQFDFTGLIRTTLTLTDNSGKNNAFAVAHARLGAKGSIYDGMFGFNILFDGTSTINIYNPTQLKGVPTLTASVKDAYLTYNPAPYFSAQMGWFIPEFNYEGTASTAARPFASLSIANGSKAGVGYRTAGLMLGAKKFQPMGSGKLGLTYLFTVANGNTNESPINQDEHFTYYGRLGANWGSYAQLLAGLRYNRVGKSPSQGSVLGWALDLNGTIANFSYLISTIGVINTPDISATGPNTSTNAQTFNVHFQYQLPWYGITPGVRYSFTDPNTDAENDLTNAFTLGLNVAPSNLPLKTVLNYTLTLPPGNADSQNQFDLVLQAQW